MALNETVGDCVDTTLPDKIEQMQMWYNCINQIFATPTGKRQGVYGQKITKKDLIHERQQVLNWLRKNEKHLQDSKE
jgi:hypothetical protein